MAAEIMARPQSSTDTMVDPTNHMIFLMITTIKTRLILRKIIMKKRRKTIQPTFLQQSIISKILIIRALQVTQKHIPLQRFQK